MLVVAVLADLKADYSENAKVTKINHLLSYVKYD